MANPETEARRRRIRALIKSGRAHLEEARVHRESAQRAFEDARRKIDRMDRAATR